LSAKFVPWGHVKLGPQRLNIRLDSNLIAAPKGLNLPTRNHPNRKHVPQFFVMISVDSKVEEFHLLKTDVPIIVIGILKIKMRD
jgi:hypothetical protein